MLADKKVIRVLFIDDDEDEYFLLKKMVQRITRGKYQYEVFYEQDRSVAREKILANAFDICLLDYAMGSWNGLELLQETKSNREIPIIMMTGHDDFHVDEQAMSLGATDYIVKSDLSSSILERTLRYALERKALMEELKHQACHDEMTGLFNRRKLVALLAHQVGAAKRYGFPLCLCFCDLDRFKNINDRYGHAAGDLALIAFSEIIRSTIRKQDFAGRYGGDEFSIILPHVALENASVCIERIQKKLSEHEVRYGDQIIQIQASFGLAQFSEEMDVASFMKQADKALYQSKEEGRNAISYA